MDVKCSRCGGAFPETEMNARFQGVCPRCLAQAAMEGETATPPTKEGPPPLASGQTFQGLEIVEVLGSGGMGVVYKARQPHLDRFVALKVLPRGLAEDPQFVERFRREAKALASLSHTNIVGVHDFGIADGVSYLVMEYIDGTNLRGALSGKKLSPEEAMAIVPQLCDALQYAHEEGIVHRDIKPENILIDRRGRVKIADFGLAKIIGGEQTRLQRITRTGFVVGTPSYMAPEQMEDPQRVDHRADIYSMGVVFYEMLTGELPLGAFVPPSFKVEVDVRLDQVVLKTLAKEPERRYQHASEVKEDVSRMTRIVAPASARAPGRGRMRALLPWLVAAAAVGFGVWGVVGRLHRDRATPPEAKTPALASASRGYDGLALSEDDIPGVWQFAAPVSVMPKAPFRTHSESDVEMALASLAEKGVTWRTRAAIRGAYFVLFGSGVPGERMLGFVAIDAGDSESVKAWCDPVFKPELQEHWTSRIEDVAIVAFGSATQPDADFEQMVGWICDRMSLSAAFERSPSSLDIGEEDLPIGCSIESHGSTAGSDKRDLEKVLRSIGARIDAREVSAAEYWRISPSDITVLFVEVPTHSARVALRDSIRGRNGHIVEGQGIDEGPWVRSFTCASAGRQSHDDFQQLFAHWRRRTWPQSDSTFRYANLEVGVARDLATSTGPAGPSHVPGQGLTAVVLSGLADADVEWTPGKGRRDLLTALEKTGNSSVLSLTAPECVKSISEGRLDIDVPGCARLSIGIGERRGDAREFVLPRTGKRLIRPDSAGWWMWGNPEPDEQQKWNVPIYTDVRDAVDEVLRRCGVNYVVASEVRGDAKSEGLSTWREILGQILPSAGAAFFRDSAGIVRVARKDRAETWAKAPAAGAADASAPRVTLDTEKADLEKSALRFAAAGGVKLTIADGVKAEFSARLVDVPWSDALAAVVATCGYALVREPSGDLRIAKEAPATPPPAVTPRQGPAVAQLTPCFFQKEDLPADWEFDTRSMNGKQSLWGMDKDSLGAILSGLDHDGVTVDDLDEAYYTCLKMSPVTHVAFVMLVFWDPATLATFEAKVKASGRWQNANRQVVLRRDRILALGLLLGMTGSDDGVKEFDALAAKLQRRIEGK